MKFVNLIDGDSDRLGVVNADGTRVLDVAALQRADIPPTCESLVHASADTLSVLRAAADRADPSCWRALDGALLGPPLRRPGKIVAIGRNYREHAEEQEAAVPSQPIVFCKFSTSIVGPHAQVVLPAASHAVDYEVELAVVVGRRGRAIGEAESRAHVFGYTVLNDVTARDLQKKDGQWVRSKSFDTFCPLGPTLVTADEFEYPPARAIRLRVNGEERQSSNTSRMIFDVPALISFLSQAFTLEPGDVIATGTPSGVGCYRNPPVFLQPDDIMEAEIEGIGVLRNAVAAGG